MSGGWTSSLAALLLTFQIQRHPLHFKRRSYFCNASSERFRILALRFVNVHTRVVIQLGRRVRHVKRRDESNVDREETSLIVSIKCWNVKDCCLRGRLFKVVQLKEEGFSPVHDILHFHYASLWKQSALSLNLSEKTLSARQSTIVVADR